MKLFYQFLEWVLPKFTHLNKLFQSEKCVIVTLYSKMAVTYTGIAITNYIKYFNLSKYKNTKLKFFRADICVHEKTT